MRIAFLVAALATFSASEARAYSFQLLDSTLASPVDEGGGDTIIILTNRGPSEPPPAKWACLWSMLFPGLGQVVLGKPLRGALFMLAFVAVCAVLVGMVSDPVPTPSPVVLGSAFVLTGIWGWSMIDAWNLGASIDGR